MAKGHKSRTMTPYKSKKVKRNRRNGMQKKAAIESIAQRTKPGFGR